MLKEKGKGGIEACQLAAQNPGLKEFGEEATAQTVGSRGKT